MIGRLVALVAFLAVGYWIVTLAVPLLTRQFGGPTTSAPEGSVESADARCVDHAERANDHLVSVARQYGQPPVDVDGWSSAMWELESQLQTASSVCGCGSSACEAGGRAVDEMRQLLTNLDGMVRGDSPGFANPANQQERIQSHLDAARNAAGL